MINALDRAMQKAWGLHGPAVFKDIGDNRFVVRFHSEGDWNHAMKNGPWQFDFHVVLLKKFDGSVRPSEMIFDSMDIWVRVLDLPMDMMNQAYGMQIGGWIGKYITADVDEDGMAWGEELRIRVEVKVDQPLLRGVSLKDSVNDTEGRWFDLKYEKVPHFCFECGCLVHAEDGCKAVSEGTKQWGEWLRASPKRSKRGPPPGRPSVSSGSGDGLSGDSGIRYRGGVSIRDIPPRRNLFDHSYSGSSHTGELEHRKGNVEVSSPMQDKGKNAMIGCRALVERRDGSGGSKGRGTFVRRARQQGTPSVYDRLEPPLGALSKKRGMRQVWLPVGVSVVGEGRNTVEGKRQRTSSVFDRIEEPAADPARQGRRDQ
jgi:hypothetical protein